MENFNLTFSSILKPRDKGSVGRMPEEEGFLVVALGSTNPVKREATERAFMRVFGEVKVIPVEVSSGVPPQPVGEQVMTGAINRAYASLKLVPYAKFGVGIEGGLLFFSKNYYLAGFVAIVDRSGRISTGMSGWFECPKNFVSSLLKGKELGDLVDELTGRKDTKKKEGAIGFFTRGIVNRSDLYEHGILMALAKFISPIWPE
ncbi:MAG TPA: inosine/xanthosine triphosphatase [Candidatus Korarchaeota archaeon]|nr:inosine/xanthosine triphosphatase [Candidatus Korarchaeota archaeon]